MRLVLLDDKVSLYEVPSMASAAIDYLKVLEAEISQTPAKYLPVLANIVHAFRESVQAEEQSTPLLPWQITAIEAGIAEADRGEFASEAEVKAAFARFGVSR